MIDYGRNLSRSVLLSVGLALGACGAPGVDDFVADARASLDQGDFATASIHLRNALQADPASVDARMLMARLGLETGDAELAVSQLEWLRDDGVDGSIYATALARAYVDLGDPAGALALLDEFASELATDASAWFVRADALLEQGDAAGAADALSRAEAGGHSAADIGLGRARLAYVERRADAARDQVARLLAANPEDAEVLVFSAILAEDGGDLAASTAALERAIDLHVANGRPLRAAPLLLALVERRVATGEIEAATADAGRLAALLPGAPMTAYATGLVAYRAGRFDDAVNALRPTVSTVPGDLRIQALLGASHLGAGNFGQAEQQFLAILGSDRDNAVAMRMLVETRLRQDRPEAALEAMRQFPEAVDESDLGLVGLRANAMLKLGDVDGAAELIRQSPGFTGDADLTASVALLLTRVRDGGEEAGASFVEELLAERPDDANSHITAAVHYQLAGEVERTVAAFDRAIELAPDNVSALAARALIAVNAQDFATAANLFERAYAVRGEWGLLASWAGARRLAGDAAWSTPLRDWIAAMPDDILARLFLAEQHQAAGDEVAALAAYDEVVERDPQNVAALNNAAWLAASLSRADALSLAQRAARLAPEDGNVLDTLGWILVQDERSGEALPYLERATQLLPELGEIQYHLAVAQVEEGDAAAARQVLDRLLAGTPPADLRRQAEQLRSTL